MPDDSSQKPRLSLRLKKDSNPATPPLPEDAAPAPSPPAPLPEDGIAASKPAPGVGPADEAAKEAPQSPADPLDALEMPPLEPLEIEPPPPAVRPAMRLRLVSDLDEPAAPKPPPAPEVKPEEDKPKPRKYVDAPPPPRRILEQRKAEAAKAAEAENTEAAPAPAAPRKFVDAPPPPGRKATRPSIPEPAASTGGAPAAVPPPAAPVPTRAKVEPKAEAAPPEVDDAPTSTPPELPPVPPAPPRKSSGPKLVLAVLLLGSLAGAYYMTSMGVVDGFLGGGGQQAAGTPPAAAAPAAQQPTGAPGSILDRVGAVTTLAGDNAALTDAVTSTANPPAEPLPHATPAGSAVEPLADVQSFIDALPISSVLHREGGTRALIGGVVYNQGDLIDPSSGLRLGAADAGRKLLTFTDARGAVYERQY